MRCLTRSSIVVAALLLSFAALAIGAALLDGRSTAQVPEQPAATQPPAAQPPAGQPAQPAPGQRQALPAPILDVPDLMRLFNKPLYLGLKETMAQQPANEQQWQELTGRGLQAAEIANLIALRKVEGPREPLLQGAAELQRAGIALADAAKGQQWEATVQAYQGLIQGCNNCHQTLAPDKAPQLKP
jgi:hypothetical protein